MQEMLSEFLTWQNLNQSWFNPVIGMIGLVAVKYAYKAISHKMPWNWQPEPKPELTDLGNDMVDTVAVALPANYYAGNAPGNSSVLRYNNLAFFPDGIVKIRSGQWNKNPEPSEETEVPLKSQDCDAIKEAHAIRLASLAKEAEQKLQTVARGMSIKNLI